MLGQAIVEILIIAFFIYMLYRFTIKDYIDSSLIDDTQQKKDEKLRKTLIFKLNELQKKKNDLQQIQAERDVTAELADIQKELNAEQAKLDEAEARLKESYKGK
jgi:hypothetical protein